MGQIHVNIPQQNKKRKKEEENVWEIDFLVE